MNSIPEKAKNIGICAVIPTYNNAGTIVKVIEDVKKYIADIFIVIDGSTDNTDSLLNDITNITIISYKKNKGKGYAIQQGFKKAIDAGFDYVLTIDSDGQHFASDIPEFINSIENNPDSLIIGSRNISADGMPSKNTFANKFSNFWFWAETNIRLPDTQSGFRLYPVYLFRKMSFFTKKYEFEIEILVRSAWKNIKIIPIPVKVYYPPEEERVSHFRPLHDFTRISVLNTVLVLITFLWILPKKAFNYLRYNKFTTIVKEQLSAHNEKPWKISAAMGFGVMMGIVPIWGFQMLVAVFLAHLLRLNKVIVLAFSNISLPPVIPIIIYFSYKAGGLVMHNPVEITSETINKLKADVMHGGFYNALDELGYSILQYIIGSFVLAVAMGIFTAITSYFIVNIAKKNKLGVTDSMN